jgi:hypothetical protein
MKCSRKKRISELPMGNLFVTQKKKDINFTELIVYSRGNACALTYSDALRSNSNRFSMYSFPNSKHRIQKNDQTRILINQLPRLNA